MRTTPSLIEIKDKIGEKIEETSRILLGLGYDLKPIAAREFYDWMTGEIFSEDKTTLMEVLGNEYLMIHEVVEVSELKKRGAAIDTRVAVDSPKELIYTAHFIAMEFELDYALGKEDYFWLKLRLGHHHAVLTHDASMPESMKPRAQEIWDKFEKYRDV